MLSILIVEDDDGVARMLRELVEVDDRYRVAAVANDLSAALAATGEHVIDVALVDINLAHLSSGYGVASELSQRGVRCIFVTGNAPPFPMPEIALGCIVKPCIAETVQSALDLAAARIAGDGRAVARNDEGFAAY